MLEDLLLKRGQEAEQLQRVLPDVGVNPQPDLGTGILVLAAGLYVIFFAGLPWKLILPALVLAAVGATALVLSEDRICEPDQLEAETIAYCEILAANAPLSMRASKYFINQLGLEQHERDEDRMERMQREAEASEDFKEATQSFLEKRKPVWRGR